MKAAKAESSSGCGDPHCSDPDCGESTQKKIMGLRRQGHDHSHDHSDIDAANKLNYQNWLEFYNQLIKLIHKLEPQTNIEGTFVRGEKHIATNASAQFRDQINRLTVYDDHGKPHEMRGVQAGKRTPVPHHPERLVVHIRELEIEYKKGDNPGSDKIEARGFKHDLFSSGFERASEKDDKEVAKKKDTQWVNESYAYMGERAQAAFSMAYMAKAQGWDKVNFDDTSDPIDRAMLIQACQHLGVDYGGETINKSVVSGVKVDPIPTNFPLLTGYSDEIQEFINDHGLDPARDKVDILCEMVFLTVLKHPDEEYNDQRGHLTCSHGPKYNLEKYPFPQAA